MRYLVTGGCGFIGSHLCDALIRQGHKVRVLDDLSTGLMENLADGAELMVGDVANPLEVSSAMADVDGCYHLAAVSSVEYSVGDWVGTHRINQQGTVNVLDAARPKGGLAAIPVVLASSAAVYGDNATQPLDESASPRPISAYGADKLGSEYHARVAWLSHGIPTAAMRFFNVYGPRQNPASPYSGVITIFMDRLLREQSLLIYGDGRQTRDFIYVGDVVCYLLSTMAGLTDGANVYNICTGQATSIGQLAWVLSIVSGVGLHVEYHPARPGDISMSLGDPGRANAVLGMCSDVTLGDGLKLTLESLHSVYNTRALV